MILSDRREFASNIYITSKLCYLVWVSFGTEIYKTEIFACAGFKGRKVMLILARPHT